MSPEALERRMDELVDKQELTAVALGKVEVSLELLRQTVTKQQTDHEACQANCRENRQQIYKRMEPLEKSQAVSTAKVSMIWGLLGTLLGGGILTLVGHLLVH